MQKTVQYVLDLCCICRASILVVLRLFKHLSVTGNKLLVECLEYCGEKLWTMETMNGAHKDTVYRQELIHLLLL